MSKENERLNNVRRLAYSLYAADVATVKRLAAMLHYQPDQLTKDIADLEAYTADKVKADRELIE